MKQMQLQTRLKSYCSWLQSKSRTVFLLFSRRASERASERNFANPDSVFEVKRFHTDAKKQLIFPLNNKTFRLLNIVK